MSPALPRPVADQQNIGAAIYVAVSCCEVVLVQCCGCAYERACGDVVMLVVVLWLCLLCGEMIVERESEGLLPVCVALLNPKGSQKNILEKHIYT